MIESDELTDDALTGSYRVFQRRRGHRYSLDDVLTAWEAATTCPTAASTLDLGCGIGSVLLMVAYKLGPARIAGIEAQPISHALCDKNLARNGLADRVKLVRGDFREPEVIARVGTDFALVTGTPPYMPVGTSTPSPDSQRMHARIEVRGGVEAYLAAASKVLAPEGALVVCAEARAPERVLSCAPNLGLAVARRRDVIPRASSKGALFTVWTLRPATAGGRALSLEIMAPFVARDEDGRRTAEYRDVRAFFDLFDNPDEAPSP